VDEAEIDEDLPEQIRIRRAKRDALAGMGRDPYPVSLPITHSIAEVRAAHPDLPVDAHTGEIVALVGRVIFARNTGKLCFATLRAGDGSQCRRCSRWTKWGRALDEWKEYVISGSRIVRESDHSARECRAAMIANAQHAPATSP
jgi:Lysyl-tRNA synthetase (class II)